MSKYFLEQIERSDDWSSSVETNGGEHLLGCHVCLVSSLTFCPSDPSISYHDDLLVGCLCACMIEIYFFLNLVDDGFLTIKSHITFTPHTLY